jgi:hypothetical protein
MSIEEPNSGYVSGHWSHWLQLQCFSTRVPLVSFEAPSVELCLKHGLQVGTMAGNEQAAQLPVIWLLGDVVWVVIGHVTSHATKQAEDYNGEPLVHFVILSNSARQAGLFSQ